MTNLLQNLWFSQNNPAVKLYFQLTHITEENSEVLKIKLRALLVALLGVSMSACAFASQPVELELDDDDVAQKLNNVSFARRYCPIIILIHIRTSISA